MRHTHYHGLREEDTLREGGGGGEGEHDPLGEERVMDLVLRVQGKPHLQEEQMG